MTGRPGILHIITDLRLGGAQRMLLARIRGCHGYRHSVAAFAAHTGERGGGPDLCRAMREAGARTHLLGIRRPQEAVRLWAVGGLSRRMDAIIREEHPAIIHSTLFHGHLLGALTAPRHRLPHLASKESLDAWMGPFERRLEAWALRRAGGIAAVSRAAADAVKTLGIPDERVRVIPNGIELRRPAASADAPGEHHAMSGGAQSSTQSGARPGEQPGASPTLVGIGRLSPVKGWEDLLHAFAIARAEAPSLALEIHGHGPLEERLLRMGRRLHLSSSFRLCESDLQAEEILSSVPAPVLIVPSREEGFGLVLLEAMAAGVPIVASRTGGIPEVVRDGVEAVLAPPRDPQALAAAILRVVRDPSLSAGMARAGRIRAREFDIAPILAAYRAWVDEFIAGE